MGSDNLQLASVQPPTSLQIRWSSWSRIEMVIMVENRDGHHGQDGHDGQDGHYG